MKSVKHKYFYSKNLYILIKGNLVAQGEYRHKKGRLSAP